MSFVIELKQRCRNTHWGCLRTGCWGEYVDLRERGICRMLEEEGVGCFKLYCFLFMQVSLVPCFQRFMEEGIFNGLI
jgi:hypothetical protein